MSNPIVNRAYLDFVLKDWLDLAAVLRRERFADHDMAAVDAVIELVLELGENLLAPCYRAADLNEPMLHQDGAVSVLPDIKQAVHALIAAGLFGAGFDEADGGAQLPALVYMAAQGLLSGANISAAAFMMLTTGNARLIRHFGSEAHIKTFAHPSIAGQTMGTMCLSEPDAGSSLADITTRAVPDGEDLLGQRFRLFGNKMWISGGDHDITENITHLVLAKIPESDGTLAVGTRAISLFIVPKILADGQCNDVIVAGLNHKMGYRGIPNCALNFGEGKHKPGGQAGAIGYLIGQAGQGLAYMFMMMNEARVTVGLGAAMLSYRGYLAALSYAKERPQGRPLGARGGPQVAIIEHDDVKLMLLKQKAFAEGGLSLALLGARLLDDEATHPDAATRLAAGQKLALLTPVIKTWTSEMGQEALHLSIQVHGGAGYTRDYLPEQLYRDNRLNPIHEGTTGIQGMDLVGRKLRREKATSFHAFANEVADTINRARAQGLDHLATPLEEVWQALEKATHILLVAPDEMTAMRHATAFLHAFGHGVVGHIWLEQALLATAHTSDNLDKTHLHQGIMMAAHYFHTIELPRIPAWLAPILRQDGTIETTTDGF
jgi:alkylation response protein AidB-like acyl-CoA dehydrogenase